jgi:uncharacterized OsmC-like protein
MTTTEAVYLGGDRFALRVRGHEIHTDQPHEAGGSDAGPTPTELFVASLAGCVGFYAERYLRRHDLPADGLRVVTRFTMSEHPARVGSITLDVVLPQPLAEHRQPVLQAVIEHCTVHNSIALPPEISIRLVIAEDAAA